MLIVWFMLFIVGAAFMVTQRHRDTGSQVTSEEDLPATEVNNPTLESDDMYYPESCQIRTYYDDSSDDEAASSQGEGVPEKEAPDCDVEEAPGCEADNI
ncbi:hypothetical protein DFH29DRAFT_1003994 [Suillus ampliporus]|nr:hypothetical protein DFH29DRAFT_1003994 [Suillus ampliporus]